MTKDLYTAADVKKVKEQLLSEQSNRCAITGMVFDPKDFHTDHRHDDEQLVRGALYKQGNMVLGKLENLWIRYLAYWYNGTLQDFLRQSADYLDLPKDKRWRHPGWIKKAKTAFNKLPSKSQDRVLELLGCTKGKNLADRKKLFAKVAMDRSLGYEKIMKAINNEN